MDKVDERGAAPQGPLQLMYNVYKYILPEVKRELGYWRGIAEQAPDPELRKQALASLTDKQFHCQGGAVYAVLCPGARRELISLIVAFQTISDYLDNLCDRSTSLDGDDFRQLHRAMLDAVQPEAPMADYYLLHPEREDGGYLRSLVLACRLVVAKLPGYETVRTSVVEWVGLYCDLQVHKHIDPRQRERELLAWWEQHRDRYPQWRWNEFAAATGSTLGMFYMFAAAAAAPIAPEQIALMRRAYFPHVCALHILLDYLIDQEEDAKGGDLNFCSYYEHMETTIARISHIAVQARAQTRELSDAGFHAMIVEGLLALYLSDPKVRSQPQVRLAAGQLMKGSPWMRLFFWANSMWIRKRYEQ